MSKFLLVNGDVKKEFVLSDQLKQTLKNLFDELNIDEEKDIRIIKSLLSHKFNLKSTVYREDKILNAMLSEIFNKDVMLIITTSSSLYICERTTHTKKQALNNGTTSLVKN